MREIVPIQETVINPRKDGCTGPKEYNQHLILGLEQVKRALDAYLYCVSEELIPELNPPLIILPMPDGFSCPNIDQSVLKEFGYLISEEDVVRLGKAFIACEEAAKIRLETGDQARQPKFEAKR